MDLGGGFPTPDLLLLPELTKILQNLGEILGGEGLSPPLQQELLQVQNSHSKARGLWLKLELIWRILRELILDPQNFQPEVIFGLEQELSWARLRRGPQKISELVPPPQLPSIHSRLLPELQRRLREKRENLWNFLLGNPKILGIPSKNPSHNSQHSQNSQNFPQIPPKIPENLGKFLKFQRLRLRRERLRERLLLEKLERIHREYPLVLSRCRSLLAQLGSLGALQAHLDGGRGRYLQAKGGASLLKSRLEELRILLDTYPAPTVEAHRRIRALLTEARQAAEAEAAILGAELGALRELGPEFRDLALELGQIRQESARKRWALRQLRPSPL